jgi:Uncharacterized protein conserved in bacteria
MIRLAVIADDLTGANDTAVQFAKRDISACVRIDFTVDKLSKEKAEVVVIDTDSRDLTAAAAYQAVEKACQAVKRCQVEHVYKKVDSTLRGNLGAEIEAAATVFGAELVAIAPAFPSNRRTTIGGYHFLDGMPIELTEIAHAPKTPVRESQITALLQVQTDCAVGVIPLAVIRQGASAIRQAAEACRERGQRWIVFDVAADEHFVSIIKALQTYENILWVGSAGLAEYLPALYSWSAVKRQPAAPAKGPVLIVAGSVSKITQKQIWEIRDREPVQLVKMQVEKLFENHAAEIKRCCCAIRKALAADAIILLASAVEEQDVLRATRLGQLHGLESCEVSEITAAALGEVAAQLHLQRAELAGLVLTGGDTAVHVCRALQAESIEILREVAAGIPLGRLAGGSCDGLQVITKAGAFGAADSFMQAVAALRGTDAYTKGNLKEVIAK